MMNESKVIQDYYGAVYYINEHKEKELTVFVVDDDEFYLQMLEKQLSKNPKFSVFTYSTGEDCLDQLHLAPDLVITDYHLDGKYSYPKKGDVIAEEIKKRLPETEVIIVSSDHKLSFVEKLMDEDKPTVFFKDGHVTDKIENTSSSILKRKKTKQIKNVISISLVIIVLGVIIYLKMF